MKLLKVKNLAHISGLVWMCAIIMFAGLVFFASNVDGRYSTTLVIIAIAGIIAFFGSILLYLIHFLFLRKKHAVGPHRSPRLHTNPFFYAFILLLILLGAVSVRGAYQLGLAKNTLQQTSITPEPTQTPALEGRYIDSDPVVSCSVNESCGGGTRQLKQSVCSNSTCCQVGNSWIFYEDKNKCLVDQSAYNTANTNKSNYIPCTVYGQTFNLTPETCRYYQGQEAGAANVKNDGYVPPYHNYETNTTPVPTTPQEQYQSAQSSCERKCTDLYKNYPDTSKARQECYASCSN